MSRKSSLGSTSPYKNILGKPWKSSFQDIQISGLTTESWGMACGGTHLAFTQQSQGGIVSVLALGDVGRSPPILRVAGHRGPIEDIHFNPFDDGMFASASDDSTVKIWKIPDQSSWKTHTMKPDKDLVGHAKKVYFCKWNPCANGVIASGSTDPSASIWDVETSKMVLTVSQPAAVLGLNWNIQGSLLVCVTQDKMVRVIDPRQQKSILESNAHDGAKSSKTVWTDGRGGDANFFITTGFTKTAGREIKVWDIRKSQTPLSTMSVDAGSGFLLPHWEESTGLLFLVPRGDTYIRPFAFDNGSLNKLDDFRVKSGQRSMAFLPQRCVDVMKSEIVRCYKGEEAGTSIVPISFCIHRKDQTKFHEDLYPPCMSGKPALEAEPWFNGQTKDPLRSNFTEAGLIGATAKVITIPEEAGGRKKSVAAETKAAVEKQKVEPGKVVRTGSIKQEVIVVKSSTPPKHPEKSVSRTTTLPKSPPIRTLQEEVERVSQISEQKKTAKPSEKDSTEVRPKITMSRSQNEIAPKVEVISVQKETILPQPQPSQKATSPICSDASSSLDFSVLEKQLKDARALADSLASAIQTATSQLNKAKQEQNDFMEELKQLGVTPKTVK